MLAQLKDALQPSVDEVSVEWLGVDASIGSAASSEPELEKKNTLLGYMKPKEGAGPGVRTTGQVGRDNECFVHLA